VDKIAAETVLDCLGKVDFLSHLKRDELRALANVFTCRTIQPGERLYTEGEPADSFFVLVSQSFADALGRCV
jgi:CRP-like cAMP-binding protein